MRLILKIPDVMSHIKSWSVFTALLLSITLAGAAKLPDTNAPPEVKWDAFVTGGAVTASPALSEDGLTLYVGSADRYFYAINTEDGSEKWKLRLPAAIKESATIDDDGTIYVPCANGALYALTDEGDTSSFKWVETIDGVERPRPFRAQRPSVTSPIVTDDGTIYVGSTDNRLYALFPEDGAVKDGWPLIAPNDVGTPVIATTADEQGDSIYFVSGGKLYGVSLDGASQSTFAPATSIHSIPAIGEDGSIFFGADDEKVYALYSGGTSNDIRWRFNTGENVSSSPVIGVRGDVYIGSESSRVYCLTTNGVLRWSVSTKRPVHSALSIGADGTIYAGSDDKNMYAITADGQVRWKFPTGGRVRSAAAIDSEGTLYFGSTDKKIYAVLDNAPSESGENVWPMFRRDRYHSARATEGGPIITQEPLGTNVPTSVITNLVRNGTTTFVVTNGATSLTVTNGDNVLVSVVARAGAPVNYQWRLDGEDISPTLNRSATNATLVLTNIQPSAAGVYSVAVENDFSIAYSDEFRLTVVSAPVLTVTLTNQFLLAGATLTLNAGAQGTPPLFYQWKTNGVAIPGATNATFTITNVQPSDALSYSVMVMNSIGMTSSDPITVTVFANPLTTQADHPLGAGPRHSLAVLTDHTLWAWGLNSLGQLGNNVNGTSTTNFASTPQLIGTNGAANTNAVWANVSAGGRGADVATNQPGGFSLAIQTNGTLWSWGANQFGQLGIGSTTLQRVPVRVGTDSNWFQVEGGATHTLALKRDGSLWSWGANTAGQLGTGDSNSTTVPLRVGGDSAWVEIRAGGFFSLARRADGTIWAWGSNTNGQLGLGTNANQRSPTMIGTDSDWAGISAGVSHALAVKTNGTLWAWGLNMSGQLGNGTIEATNRPAQSGTEGGWSLVEAGSFHSFAIRTNGALFAWGANWFGQLGNGQIGMTFTNDADQLSPTPIATNETWRAIDASTHSLGMTTDGRVFAWGWNSHGQVGNGNTNNQVTPALLSFIASTNSSSTNNTSTNSVSTNPPSITQQPVDRLANEGSAVSFSVIATGAPPISYQWYSSSNNQINVSNPISSATNPSATNATLLITNVQGGVDNRGYVVLVSNSLGSITSTVVALTVTNTNGFVFFPNTTGSAGVPITNSQPFITEQPTNQTVLTNSTVNFSVLANGAMPLFYQWRFNSNAIALNFNVTADTATTATLTLSNVVVTNSGFYDVVVTNSLGAVTSAPVRLVVTNGAIDITPGVAGTQMKGAAPTELRLGTITFGTDGVAIEVIGGVNGKKLVLEYKESLLDSDWRPLNTNDSGTLKLYDTTPPTVRSRFYRVRAE